MEVQVTKGEQTRREIVQKAAPLFNQKGYEGTSLSDLMKALDFRRAESTAISRARKNWRPKPLTIHGKEPRKEGWMAVEEVPDCVTLEEDNQQFC